MSRKNAAFPVLPVPTYSQCTRRFDARNHRFFPAFNVKFLQIITLILILPFAALAANKQNPSGLPLPRFASLKSAEVNVRTGPGTRYPISWVFRREGMPVEIIDEFDHWRKIRDIEGSSGWVHKIMLSGERMALIQGKEPRTLRESPAANAVAVLKAEPMVIGKLLACEKEWCKLLITGHKGWMPKSQFWGAYPAEIAKY